MTCASTPNSPLLRGLSKACASVVLFLLGFSAVQADEADGAVLADLSLDELLSTEITTLSRKAENLGSAPAAVHVISQSDIRRSGARSIPELLRMVPGMQVAQIDGNKWAVTSRGAATSGAATSDTVERTLITLRRFCRAPRSRPARLLSLRVRKSI